MVCDHGGMSFAGRLLVATPLITDPHFFHTVVYLYAYEPEEGAAGVVVNRPTEEPTIEHLPEWRSRLSAPPVVFWGGPVTPEAGVVVIVDDGKLKLADDLEPPSPPVRGRLFVGQSGWGPGQLEAEIDEGAWIITDAPAEEVLGPAPDQLWTTLLRREGGRAAMWATHPPDPRMN